MCGRYYVDDETAREINKLIKEVDEKLNLKSAAADGQLSFGAHDIYPTNEAPILTAGENGGFKFVRQRWGFPGIRGKGVIINARSETAYEKRMFSESVKNRRCVIPAAHFYEWNAEKEKITFLRKDSPVLFMAGFYKPFEDGERFVILTSPANSSAADVHDRMPLILERAQLEEWLFDGNETGRLLTQVPAALKRDSEYEQGVLKF